MRQGSLWIAVLAFVALGILCLSRGANRIETELGTRASAALLAEALPTEGLSFSGRDALLTASLGANGTFEQARDVIAAVPGVRAVFRALRDGGDTTSETAPTSLPPGDPTPPGLEDDIRTVMDGRTIEFQSGSAEITAAGRSLLDEIAALLLESPDIRLQIEGHTDSSGDPARNQALSEQRAEAVLARLVSAGIVESRLTAVGFGATRPIADNTTPEGSLANRRIEFHVIEEN